MINSISSYAEKYNMFPKCGLILVAVSGGSDSMCLLHILYTLSQSSDFSIAVVHFNHGLRGEASDADASFVESYCQELGIPCYIGKGNTAEFAAQSHMGIEAAGRKLRYDFFLETAKIISAKKIATAHTADDNAETVLLNLCRGAGLRGLSGIPPVRDQIIRPLLSISRVQIEQYLQIHSIPHREDATNREDVYNRNKLRHHVMPILKTINPAFCNNIESMTELIREDEQYLSSLAETFLQKHPTKVIPIKDLISLPRPIAYRAIRLCCPSNLSSSQTAAVIQLCQDSAASGQLCLPSVCVYKEYGFLSFSKPEEEQKFTPIVLIPGKTITLPALHLKISCQAGEENTNIYKSFISYLFNLDKICGNIVLRPRMAGDTLCLPGRGTKKLKKLFAEQKIPLRFRYKYPVLADDCGVLAVIGLGADKRTCPLPDSPVLKIIIEEII